MRSDRLAACFVGLILLGAGLVKLVDPQPTRMAVEYLGVQGARVLGEPLGATGVWSIEGLHGLSHVVMGLLVGAEVMIGLGLIVTGARWIAACALALLGVFSVVVVFMGVRANAPGCGCFGRFSSDASMLPGLLRNLGLGLCALWAWWGAGTAAAPDAKPASGLARMRPRAAGFTLVELLVCIGLIAVLIGLALPAFRGARQAAKTDAALADLRDLSLGLASYLNESGDVFPYLATPNRPYDGLVVGANRFQERAYFDQSAFYVELLAQGGLVRDELINFDTSLRMTHSRLAQAAFASPEFWSERYPPRLAHLRATSLAHVRYPSQKGLLLDTLRWLPGGDRPVRFTVAWVDGAATDESSSAAIGVRAVRRSFGSWGEPVLGTAEGWRGVDKPSLVQRDASQSSGPEID